MTPHQDSSIFQKQQLQATPTRSIVTGFRSNRIFSDVLRHCSKIVSILSLIGFNCPHAISIQWSPVIEHLTQYVPKCTCLSNKINNKESKSIIAGKYSHPGRVSTAAYAPGIITFPLCVDFPDYCIQNKGRAAIVQIQFSFFQSNLWSFLTIVLQKCS
jgi:hypothetical protein